MTTLILEKIYSPIDVTDVPYGATAEEVKSYLKDVEILLNDGRIMRTTVNWGEPSSLEPVDEYASRTWIANGIIDLPESVRKKSEDQSLNIKETYKEDTTIKIHEAPTRKGYTFQYWRGSAYHPGQSYTVIDNHTFTAVWLKDGPGPNPSPIPGVPAPNTSAH